MKLIYLININFNLIFIMLVIDQLSWLLTFEQSNLKQNENHYFG